MEAPKKEPGGTVKKILDLIAQLQEEHAQAINSLKSEIIQQGEVIDVYETKDAANESPRSRERRSTKASRGRGISGDIGDTSGDIDDIAISGGDIVACPSRSPSICRINSLEQKFAEEKFELKNNWNQAPAASGKNAFAEEVDEELLQQQANSMLDTVSRMTVKCNGDDHPVDYTCHPDNVQRRRTVIVVMQRLSLVIDPSLPQRIAWDLAGMFLITYDMIMIPVFICFDPDPSWWVIGMGWITLLFWTCDMIASVFTGYYADGKLVMSQKKIILNYLKGWFWVDCIVVLPDWIFKAMGSMTSIAGLGRILRIARIARVLRLLRLLKLKKLFNIVYDVIDSEVTFICFNLSKLVMSIVFMNHLVACMWYWIGARRKDAGDEFNWLQDVGKTPVWETQFAWKYLTSLHWSITQFTPASMDVYATNVSERAFSVVILFWALVALSSIIGSVSASMTALRNMSADENKHLWMLRRYLKQKSVNRPLVDRIMKYLEFQQAKAHNKVLPGQVKLLGALSPHFQEELAHELTSPFLVDHPFFQSLGDEVVNKRALSRICKSAVSVVPCAHGEMLFSPGDEGQNMYFIKSGTFAYSVADGKAFNVFIGPKLWASEAVLWTDWRHRGWMKAKEPAEAVAVNPNKFSDVFHMHPKTWYQAKHYGTEFVKYMNGVDLCALTDVMFFVLLDWQFSQQQSIDRTDAEEGSAESIDTMAFAGH